MAVESSVTVVEEYVPLALAVFGYEPAVELVVVEKVQVAICLFFPEAGLYNVNGAVSGVPSPSTHEQLMELPPGGSVTFTELKSTSPTFSTVNL